MEKQITSDDRLEIISPSSLSLIDNLWTQKLFLESQTASFYLKSLQSHITIKAFTKDLTEHERSNE